MGMVDYYDDLRRDAEKEKGDKETWIKAAAAATRHRIPKGCEGPVAY